jgi:hypothetical protein
MTTAMEPMEYVEPNRAGLPTRVPGAHLAPGAVQERQQALPDNGFRIRRPSARTRRGIETTPRGGSVKESWQ